MEQLPTRLLDGDGVAHGAFCAALLELEAQVRLHLGHVQAVVVVVVDVAPAHIGPEVAVLGVEPLCFVVEQHPGTKAQFLHQSYCVMARGLKRLKFKDTMLGLFTALGSAKTQSWLARATKYSGTEIIFDRVSCMRGECALSRSDLNLERGYRF